MRVSSITRALGMSPPAEKRSSPAPAASGAGPSGGEESGGGASGASGASGDRGVDRRGRRVGDHRRRTILPGSRAGGPVVATYEPGRKEKTASPAPHASRVARAVRASHPVRSG